jgi:hypothetical protein
MTNGHETNHHLNAEMRNATSATDNTVYFEGGKAAMVTEPAMSAVKIRDYVPAWVKQHASRYQTYVVDQVDNYWSNVLYQFDEWSAYRTDARIAVELDKAGTFGQASQGEICVMDGAIEFLYFASAAVNALAHNEPAYLQNTQFKAAFAMLAEQSLEFYGYGKGKQSFDCDGTGELEHYKTSPDNAANRAAVKDWMGAAWTQRVLGF